MFVATVTIKW